MTEFQSEDAVRIGVSSCLLGEKVRYDGGHKRDRFVTDQLGPWVQWVAVCPEVEAGLGLPRPTMQLARNDEEVRVIETKSGRDHTNALESFSRRRVRELRRLDLAGYILKKDSPSCGMARVKVRNAKGMPEKVGVGVFAGVLQEVLPSLPVEEEGRLADLRLRENFIERIFAFQRLSILFRGRWTVRQIMGFHAAHRLQLMAHSTGASRELDRRVAVVKTTPRAEFREAYVRDFMAALSKMATPGRNAKVLQHAAGYFKKQLPSEQRVELAGLIRDYREGLVPLAVPVALVRHYARLYEVESLEGQLYLEPHPGERMLRNHV